MTGSDSKKLMLIVDDSKTNRAILHSIFEKDYELTEASDGLEASTLLKQKNFSVIILDLNMPNMDGFQLLDMLNADPKLKNIPVIINTQFGQEENELKALSKGASDFISKPYNIEIVRHRVNNVIMTTELAQQMINTEAEKRTLEKLHHLAETDSLTGVYSEQGFCHYADELRKSKDTEYTLLRFDVNHFKAINELFGAEKSLAILKLIADRLKVLVGNDGICGRLGADIFTVCMPTDKLDAEKIVNDLEQLISKTLPGFNASIYSAIYCMNDPETSVELMLDRAGLAIQQIKGNYLDRFTKYNGLVKDVMLKEQSLTSDMEFALGNNEFCIHIQPIYDIHTGRVVSAEALVRWNHSKRGLLPPDSFIPLFERNGMIAKLDHHVWGLACAFLKKLIDEGVEPVPISVNVSRVNLFLPSLGDDIVALLDKYGIDREYLKLEITESARTADQTRLVEAVEKLKELGFTIVMDDFGTGYSSLRVLKDMPIDVVKIDMNFVAELGSSNKASIIVKHMSTLAKALGMTVIAEGVETKEQLGYLKSVECDQLQGYYFSKPLTEDDFIKLMKKS
ncbi:MAG: EAL domain-containing protein [Lachnospiraceae bacterium]